MYLNHSIQCLAKAAQLKLWSSMRTRQMRIHCDASKCCPEIVSLAFRLSHFYLCLGPFVVKMSECHCDCCCPSFHSRVIESFFNCWFFSNEMLGSLPTHKHIRFVQEMRDAFIKNLFWLEKYPSFLFLLLGSSHSMNLFVCLFHFICVWHCHSLKGFQNQITANLPTQPTLLLCLLLLHSYSSNKNRVSVFHVIYRLVLEFCKYVGVCFHEKKNKSNTNTNQKKKNRREKYELVCITTECHRNDEEAQRNKQKITTKAIHFIVLSSINGFGSAYTLLVRSFKGSDAIDDSCTYIYLVVALLPSHICTFRSLKISFHDEKWLRIRVLLIIQFEMNQSAADYQVNVRIHRRLTNICEFTFICLLSLHWQRIQRPISLILWNKCDFRQSPNQALWFSHEPHGFKQ